MPTYAYRCTKCGYAFDAVQSFSDAALTVCPKCGGPLRKVFSPVGVVFKGSGFYHNDSRQPGPKTPHHASSGSGGKGGDVSGSDGTRGQAKESSGSSGTAGSGSPSDSGGSAGGGSSDGGGAASGSSTAAGSAGSKGSGTSGS